MKKLKAVFLSLFLIFGCNKNNNKMKQSQNEYHPDHEGYPELEMIHGHERQIDGPP